MMRTKIAYALSLAFFALAALAADIPQTPLPHCPQTTLINVAELPNGRDTGRRIRLRFNQSAVGALLVATNNINVIPIEYLESPATPFGISISPYIDTGYVPRMDSGVRLVFSSSGVFGDYHGFYGMFGSGGNLVPDGQYRIWYNLEGGGSVVFSLGRSSVTRVAASGTNIVQTVCANYMNDGKLSCLSTNDITGSFDSFITSYLFAVCPSNTIAAASRTESLRVYECQITEGTNVVHDFKPVRIGPEGSETEGAMRDELTGALYRNARPYEKRILPFVCGPDL